jgi:TPR repeat protein
MEAIMNLNTEQFRAGVRTALFVGVGLVLLAATGSAQQFAAKDAQDTVMSDCLPAASHLPTNPPGTACYSTAIAELEDSSRTFVLNQAGIESALVLGPNRSIEDARWWFQKAAARGSGPAQVNLAVFYLNGWGVPKNYGSALYWLKSAAAQGIPRADTNLGILYLNGWGVHQDYAEARRYFQMAAEHGDSAAMVNLGYVSDEGLGAPENKSAAADWYRKAADGGNPFGQNNLADLYLRGEGVPQNDALAFAWFQKAADQGHTGARIKLGFLYLTGRGVSENAEAAYAWILAASLAGDHRGDEYFAPLKAKLDSAQLARAKQRARELHASSQRHISETAFLR